MARKKNTDPQPDDGQAGSGVPSQPCNPANQPLDALMGIMVEPMGQPQGVMKLPATPEIQDKLASTIIEIGKENAAAKIRRVDAETKKTDAEAEVILAEAEIRRAEAEEIRAETARKNAAGQKL